MVSAVSTTPSQAPLRRLDSVAVSAGISALLLSLFGPLPVLIAVAGDLGLSAAQTSSWIFAAWLTGGISSLLLALHYRQPIAVTLSVPSLVYLGTLAGRLGHAEIAAANLVAGVIILALAVLGIGERIVRWLPGPIAVAAFAGTLFQYVLGAASATVADVTVGGAVVAGYALARRFGSDMVPPVAVGALLGAPAVVVGDGLETAGITWALPAFGVPAMTFAPLSVVTVAVPLVLLALGLGNVQGLGFLRSQGYLVPANRISLAVGLASIASALLGGHQASVGRTSVAIVGGPDAGPRESRYQAAVVAALLAIATTLGAGTVVALLAALPASYVAAVTGIAILATFQSSVATALRSKLRLGSIVAFTVAATPFVVGGFTSAAFAVVAGMLASLVLERRGLARLAKNGHGAREADAHPGRARPVAARPGNIEAVWGDGVVRKRDRAFVGVDSPGLVSAVGDAVAALGRRLGRPVT